MRPLANTFSSVAQQRGDNDCGPAAMSFIALALGRSVTPGSIRSMAPERALPWSLFDLKVIAGRLGFESELLHTEDLRDPGWYVLYIPGSLRGHFVAARRDQWGRLQAFDPASGIFRAVRLSRLKAIWRGDALRLIREYRPSGFEHPPDAGLPGAQRPG